MHYGYPKKPTVGNSDDWLDWYHEAREEYESREKEKLRKKKKSKKINPSGQ